MRKYLGRSLLLVAEPDCIFYRTPSDATLRIALHENWLDNNQLPAHPLQIPHPRMCDREVKAHAAAH